MPAAPDDISPDCTSNIVIVGGSLAGLMTASAHHPMASPLRGSIARTIPTGLAPPFRLAMD
jgi:hypothetical protein